MLIYKGIKIEKSGTYWVTYGLEKNINKNLKIFVGKNGDDQNYVDILQYIIDYILLENSAIKSNQTIAYHSWILKFMDMSGQHYSLWEADSAGNDYCEGVEYSIKVIKDEIEECTSHGVNPLFPTFGQQMVISKGVYEGLAIEAVRYHSPGHMTGWWLTTESYDGNINSLMTVHFWHVAFSRPDILRFLALPPGFRFFINSNACDVWLNKPAGYGLLQFGGIRVAVGSPGDHAVGADQRSA